MKKLTKKLGMSTLALASVFTIGVVGFNSAASTVSADTYGLDTQTEIDAQRANNEKLVYSNTVGYTVDAVNNVTLTIGGVKYTGFDIQVDMTDKTPYTGTASNNDLLQYNVYIDYSNAKKVSDNTAYTYTTDDEKDLILKVTLNGTTVENAQAAFNKEFTHNSGATQFSASVVVPKGNTGYKVDVYNNTTATTTVTYANSDLVYSNTFLMSDSLYTVSNEKDGEELPPTITNATSTYDATDNKLTLNYTISLNDFDSALLYSFSTDGGTATAGVAGTNLVLFNYVYIPYTTPQTDGSTGIVIDTSSTQDTVAVTGRGIDTVKKANNVYDVTITYNDMLQYSNGMYEVNSETTKIYTANNFGSATTLSAVSGETLTATTVDTYFNWSGVEYSTYLKAGSAQDPMAVYSATDVQWAADNTASVYSIDSNNTTAITAIVLASIFGVTTIGLGAYIVVNNNKAKKAKAHTSTSHTTK